MLPPYNVFNEQSYVTLNTIIRPIYHHMKNERDYAADAAFRRYAYARYGAKMIYDDYAIAA